MATTEEVEDISTDNLDPEDDIFSDEDEGGGEDGTGDVSLGFAVKRDDPAELLRNQFLSKMGGRPAWLDPAQLPVESTELRCKPTGEPLRFLLQLYAPTEDDEPRAFHRALYLFISPKGARLAEPGAVRAFRCQLPRRNAFYPYEPPEADERPTPLSTAAARLATRRCPTHADGGEAESASAGACFPEHELVVEPEPDESETAAANPDVNRVLEQYEAKLREVKEKEKEKLDKEREKERAKEGGAEAKESVEGGGEEENDLSAFAGTRNPEVEDFGKFSLRVSRAPDQCVRYTFAHDASPLWASRKRQPAASDIPACERCGAPRRFEFQVMPQAIAYLDVDSANDNAPDWATIAVYTCSKSCAPIPPLPDHGMLEDPKTAGLASDASAATAAVATAAVGMRCRIEGLNSRPDLNGTECEVLHWHVPSGRWAIECDVPSSTEGAAAGEGEKMRVRSANLRPLPFAAGGDSQEQEGGGGGGVPREGGYAEEFVWVQSH